MARQDEMVGAAKSLNKTITEILAHLDQDGADRPGPYEDKRAYLYDKISDLMIKRFKNGFKRGHSECHRIFDETGSFPRALSYKAAPTVIGGKKRKFTCTSKLKDAK